MYRRRREPAIVAPSGPHFSDLLRRPFCGKNPCEARQNKISQV
jgi:hypothetical protein